jgi:hypothetical protein
VSDAWWDFCAGLLWFLTFLGIAFLLSRLPLLDH